jgi:hypothetical protein
MTVSTAAGTAAGLCVAANSIGCPWNRSALAGVGA